MEVQCKKCGSVNRIQNVSQQPYRCGKCGAFLPTSQQSGDTSQAVGLIGGAALGAAIGGPVGAIVGGVLGAILGKEGKGGS